MGEGHSMIHIIVHRKISIGKNKNDIQGNLEGFFNYCVILIDI